MVGSWCHAWQVLLSRSLPGCDSTFDILPHTVDLVGMPLKSCLIIVQAHATEETERANNAEAEVDRLGQEVNSRGSEGRGWQQQLQQAQQDLSAALVCRT